VLVEAKSISLLLARLSVVLVAAEIDTLAFVVVKLEAGALFITSSF
jgi:hypothetical protein